ncbi:MAG: PEP-CTERM sorting domain-containing protein [Terriglobales bacterium]
MRSTKWFGYLTILCLLCLVSSVAAFADAPLVLTPPNVGHFLGYGAGGTRGDIITMTGNYTLTSIGIDAEIDLGAQLTFNAYVYDDEGGSGVIPLAIGAPMVLTGTGTETWYDLPIAFTLLAGQSYDIGISFNSFNDPHLQVNYYFFDSGANPPFSVGPVTVLDGEESHCGPCNIFAPNLRLNGAAATPEPNSMLLLAAGALGLLGRRKK